MAQPNVTQRTREIGFVNGQALVNGGILNNYVAAPLGALNPGVEVDSFGFQINHALLGGASTLFAGNSTPPFMLPTRAIAGVHDSHCLYGEVLAHLRSAGNVDLPGQLRFFVNEYPPLAAFVPAPTQFDLGDWVAAGWQEWEKWSPLTIPTPPPGFTGGGAGGIRYEYRRLLGRVPGNFMFVSLTNRGSVAALEWGISVIMRTHGQEQGE